jgi:hypothetical protein
MKPQGIIVGAALFLAGCASSSKDIAPAYVSPLIYKDYTCDQLSVEAQRVSSQLQFAAGVVDKNASNDAVATGVAIVVFWPAALLIKGDGAKAQEYASLQGQMTAIEQTATLKNCGIQFQQAPEKSN